jgi:hypothetical protein
MANTIPREQIAEGIHVRDCYVWTEISYLDSPSDYREYLPQDRQWKPNDDLFVLLDLPRQSLRSVRDSFCGSPIGNALAGLAVVAITILTIVCFYTLVDL